MRLRDFSFLLLPGRCRFCDGATGRALDLCDACEADLPRNTPACGLCALPLVSAAPICGPCAAAPPPVTRTIAPLRYEHEVRALIADLKFHGRLSSLHLLGSLLADAVRAAYAGDDLPPIVTPISLGLWRLIRRGHDQAALLALRVTSELGLPTPARLVERVRATRPQAGLGAAARRRNVRGAFALRFAPAARHVAIVDDVLTTGATAYEVARLLRNADVERIDLWVVARTPAPHR